MAAQPIETPSNPFIDVPDRPEGGHYSMSIPSRAVHGRPPTRSAALCAAILTTGNQNDGNVPLRPPIDESPGGWLTSCSSGARRADRSLCVPRRRLRQFRFQVSHRTLALGAPLASCRAGSAGSTGHRLSRRGSNTIHLGLLLKMPGQWAFPFLAPRQLPKILPKAERHRGPQQDPEESGCAIGAPTDGRMHEHHDHPTD